MRVATVSRICTLIVGVTSMAVIVAQTAWFKEWLRGFIVRQADDYVNGRLTIGRLDGNLFFGVEMEDVNVAMNGQPVVALKDVGVDYNLLTFLGGHVILNHIRLNEIDGQTRARIMPLLRLQGAIDAQGLELSDLCGLPPKAVGPAMDAQKTPMPPEFQRQLIEYYKRLRDTKPH